MTLISAKYVLHYAILVSIWNLLMAMDEIHNQENDVIFVYVCSVVVWPCSIGVCFQLYLNSYSGVSFNGNHNPYACDRFK